MAMTQLFITTRNFMKNLLTLAIASFILIAGGQAAHAQLKLKTQLDSISYSLGVQLGQQLLSSKFDINLDALTAGIKDQFGSKSQLTDAEVAAMMTLFQQKMQELASNAGESNMREQQEFLGKNRKREGVKQTASGLQYMVLQEGDGPSPSATDEVTVHYHGTLLDGTVFDSSVQRGEPTTFPVNGVIKGWTEALQMMKVGSKWRLFIPSNLAYGERSVGQHIGPNQMLIFEVELLGIK
jgi:FKBP-type peptidyl-prolyl cis-trans isomerase FklB